jgi:hypothetical protein
MSEKELDIVQRQDGPIMSVTISAGASTTELAQRARLIDETYRKIMKRDVHFGVIPGTSGKPSLLKAGAEKLLSLFNLGAMNPVIKETLLPEGHREYRITIDIKHYPTDRLVGCGIGLCSTMESKYRYRNVADFEVTGEVIPRDAKEKKKEYRQKGYGMKLVDGSWEWVKYGDSEKSENPDIADQYNTVLKMAVKRALVAGTLVVTGASDIFTQDVEDFATMGKDDDDAPPAEGGQGTVTKPPAPPTKPKVTVVEGPHIIDAIMGDVQEKKLEDGKLYYIADIGNGKTAGTVNKEIAEKAASVTGKCKIEVRQGRRPGSLVLLDVVSVEEAVE